MRKKHASVNSKAALITPIKGKEQMRYFLISQPQLFGFF